MREPGGRTIADDALERSAWDAAACESSPLFWPIRERARRLGTMSDWPAVESYDALLDEPRVVQFRPPVPRPRRGARRRGAMLAGYDAWIQNESIVPTWPRSWHDYMNALVWSVFPRTKRALHARQAASLQAARPALHGGRRTREQDALAMLDEGGVALLCSDHAVAEARAALMEARPRAIAELVRSGDALGVIYGHAIYEHLACGGPAVRAMTSIVPCARIPERGGDCVDAADEGLAILLASEGSFARPEDLGSLPVSIESLGAPRTG
jgi:hypothetical protein